MNISNPKVIVFFLALLPSFVDYEKGNEAFQIMILGLIFMVSTLIVFGSIAIFAGYLGGFFRSKNFYAAMKYLKVLIFFIIGISVFLR